MATATFEGQLIRPGDPRYDEARAVWNGAIDRRPAIVARCRDAADVGAAIRLARERGLPVAVRGGGHSIGGLSVCDGGVVVDLSPMRAIAVDPAARRARAGAGVLWGELDDDQMRRIDALDRGEDGRTGPNPDVMAYIPRS